MACIFSPLHGLAQTVSETDSYFTIAESCMPADGISTRTISVYIKAATQYSPLSGRQVTLYSSRGPASDTVVMINAITNANGQCTGRISSAFPGEVNIYGICDTATITENLVTNCSFETGGITSVTGWTLGTNHGRNVAAFKSGNYSLRSIFAGAGGTSSYPTNLFALEPHSYYRLKGWIRDAQTAGNAYFDVNDLSYDLMLGVVKDNTWRYTEGDWNSYANFSGRVRCVTDGTPAGTVYFDAMRFYRIPTLTFLPVKEIPIAIQAESTDIRHLGGGYASNPSRTGGVSSVIWGTFWCFYGDSERLIVYCRVPQVWTGFETQWFKVSVNAVAMYNTANMAVSIDDANTQYFAVNTATVTVYTTNTFSLSVGFHKLVIMLPNGGSTDLYLDWIGIGPVKNAIDPPAFSREEISIFQDNKYVSPIWEFNTAGNTEGWEGYNGASITGVSGGSLNLTTTNTPAMMLSPWINVTASENYYVSFRMKVDKGTTGKLQWVRKNTPGPLGERSFALELDNEYHVYNIDLHPGTGYSMWGNTWDDIIKGIVLLPSDALGANIQIDWIRISNLPQNGAEVKITYFGVKREGRIGESIPITLDLKNFGGEPAEFVRADLYLPAGVQVANGGNTFGLTALYDSTTFSCTVVSYTVMSSAAFVTVSGKNFAAETASCTITIVARLASDTDYPPVPNTVTTPYDVGMYYFPGWKESAKDVSMGSLGWDRIRPEFSERKPYLGWYDEGETTIADWHIKWMVDHGVKFIAYDWYHQYDMHFLEHAINAYLGSKYRSYINFCVTWCDHFEGHTRDLMLEVTQYWIDHYFNQPEYYKISNKPVVIIFSPLQMKDDLGSTTAVLNVFTEMRQMCVNAGYAGLYIIGLGLGGSYVAQTFKDCGYDAATGYNYSQAGMSDNEKAQRSSPYYKAVPAFKYAWEEMQLTGILPFIAFTEPGWDDRPWAGANALVRTNRNKADFKSMLLNARTFADSYPISGKKIVMVECWNEFGEGEACEPNNLWGFDMADAVREVFVGDTAHIDMIPADIGQSVKQWTFSTGDGPWYSPMAKAGIRLSSNTAGYSPVYDTITFTTTRADTISRVTMHYPECSALSGVSLVSVQIGSITSGTVSALGETITFIATTPNTVSSGTNCTITLSNIGNPIKKGIHNLYVTTYNNNLQPVDGFTPCTFTIAAGAFSSTSSYIILPASVPANGTVKCTVTVIVADTYRNPVSGRTVVIVSSGGAGNDTITQPGSATDSNGMCEGYVVSTKPGKDTITATVSGSPGVTITNVVFRDIAVGAWNFEDSEGGTSFNLFSAQNPYLNNAAIQGNTSETFGYRGAGKSFDGSGGYMQVLDNDSLDPAFEITVELWYRTSVSQSDKWMVNKISSSGADGYRIGFSGGNFVWQVPGFSPWSYSLSSPAAAPLNVWTHVAGTYGGNTLSLYVNGQKVSTLYRSESGINNSSLPLYMGGRDYNYGFFTGCIDELRIYDRALTDAEISLSSQLRPKPVTFTGIETKIVIISPPRGAKQGNPTEMIRFEVQDYLSQRVVYFNDTVSLLSSSQAGRFSPDLSGWSGSNTYIMFASEGTGHFYYKDTTVGSPTVTVSRTGLTPGAQAVNIAPPYVSNTASYITFIPYQIPADGNSVCNVIVTVKEADATPFTGKIVTLSTTRGALDTIRDSNGIAANTQPTDVNGTCTWTITSATTGWDTILARCEGNTITRGITRYGAQGIFPFDNNTADISGNGNNGTVSGGPVYSSGSRGIGLKFDESTKDFVNTTISIDQTSSSSPGATFMAWVYPTSTSAGRHHVISTDNGGFDWSLLREAGTWYVFTGNNSLSTGYSVDPDTWQHVAAVFEPGNTRVRFYKNGVETIISSLDYDASYNNVRIAANPLWAEGGEFFTGSIDEPCIYTRTLSDTEIKAYYYSRANIYFTFASGPATRLEFQSQQVRIRAADTSSQIVVAAKDAGGNTAVTFNNTVSLFTSSNSGSFSVSATSWANTTAITFQSGFGYFYYRDNAVGYPVITAYRLSLIADTQTETVSIRTLRFANTIPFTITSISTAPVFIKAGDGLGNTAVLYNDTVQLLTTSTKGYFSVSGTTWANTSVIYLSSGSKTIYYRDKIGGNPVITVTRTDSWTWTDTQQETVTKPTVQTSKVQMNVRSGETGSYPMKFWVSDTVEYTVYISNTGTETATNNLIVDTRSFDTNVNNPVDYITMDTNTIASTWAYTIDPTFSVWITGSPVSGASNVKGLRWRVTTLGINETKAIRFRVRVK